MKNLIYSVLGLALGSLLSLQSFAANANSNQPASGAAKESNNKETSTSTSNKPSATATTQTQEGANAEREMSNSGQPLNKGRTSKNVQGRDTKRPTDSLKNAQPSQLKTQERTETVE